MKTSLVIHIASLGQDGALHARWCLGDAMGQVRHQGIWAEGQDLSLPVGAGIERAIILLPSSDVFVRQVRVPAKSDREARMAIPFVIEDYLATPLEETHISVGDKIDAQGTRWVFAAAQALVARWQDFIQSLNIKPVYVLPDAMALEGHGGDLTVVAHENFALYQAPAADLFAYVARIAAAKAGEGASDADETAGEAPALNAPLCGGFELSLGDMALPSLGAALAPKRLLISHDINPALIVPGPEPVALKRMANPDLAASAARLPSSVLGLMPKVFGAALSARIDWAGLAKPWILAASLSVLAGISYLGFSVFEGFYYQSRTQAYRTASEQAFRTAFPDVNNIRNLRAQLRQRVGTGSAQSGAQFLDLAARLQTLLSDIDTITIQSLRFDGQSGDLRVSALYSDFSDFERLRAAAEGQDLVLVDGGARQSSAGISGDFTVRRR
ncbi:type II secretion system protein GspL [Woodsholea maritima]|uniref:type II secretion system protein GspL n=1 Tax=Woodsholea maritima TaxID=240237 RepID=UPI0003640558|nr:type II secretion system protein GspL [Woodsholea maritima]